MAAAQRKAAPRPDASADASSLVGAYVWAMPFDDPQYRHEMHKGLIMAEKKSCGILWVHFKADDLLGLKWIPMHRIKGRAPYTQKAAS